MTIIAVLAVILTCALLSTSAFIIASQLSKDRMAALAGMELTKFDTLVGGVMFFYIWFLLLFPTVVNAVPLLAFRYVAQTSQKHVRRIAPSDRGLQVLADYPYQAFAVLGVVSACLSAFVFPKVVSGGLKAALSLPSFYLPPLIFGCVLAAGEWFVAGRGGRQIAQVICGSVVAWSVAYSVGYWVWFMTNGQSMLGAGTGAILTGLIAGGVGAVIVAISTPTLRQAGNWEISALLGSLAGLGFWFFDTVTAQTLGMFIVWQVMVAVFFAHRLRASVSTGRRPG